ncbi:MAG: BatD family protein [Gemmatimonadota bacterium]|nr:BatD family protein [Gemmatimonadota bacterium]MXX13399.1 protein BatD [Gemmatimonadota bacterium]MYB58949.1 protein BatD [Gemmatimonadota bacterium]
MMAMHGRKRWIFLCGVFFALLWAQGIDAQDVMIRASVDRTRVEVGDLIQFRVEVEAAQMGSVSAPQVPTPDGLQLTGSTSSTSMSVNIVNGEMTTKRTTTYVFSFRAQRVGTHVLGPAQLAHEGKTLRSDQVRIEVVKRSGRPQTRPAPSTGRSMGQSEIQEIEQNLFLQAIPEKRMVYVGEQVGVTYKLFTRYDLRNVQYGHVPTFTGFWAETVFDAQRLNMQREVVDGRAFNTALLKRLALFPTTAGKHTLEQLEVNCEVVGGRRSRGLFDFDPFGAFDTQQVAVRSGDIEIEVIPLPAGAPKGFGGTVGKFEMRAEAIPGTMKAGDPVAVKVVVQGAGNLHAINEPIRPERSGFKFYDPKTNLETRKRGTRISGQKTFEYVAIPYKTGQVILPPFILAYFDPVQKLYKTVQTKPITLQVTPGEQMPQPVDGLPGEEVRALGRDIRYIKPDRMHLADQGLLLYQRSGFWFLQLIPVLGVAGAYAYRRHRVRLEGDVAYARRRRSRSEAQRRLGKARGLMEAGDSAGFHGEVHRSLSQFVADRTNRVAAGLTADQIGAMLVERGVDAQVIAGVQDVFGQCDQARFAPGQISAEQMQALFAQTEDLIGALERCI